MNGVPKYDELMSLADLEVLAEGEGEREALLSDESELVRSSRLDLGRGESDFGESGIESGDAWSKYGVVQALYDVPFYLVLSRQTCLLSYAKSPL